MSSSLRNRHQENQGDVGIRPQEDERRGSPTRADLERLRRRADRFREEQGRGPPARTVAENQGDVGARPQKDQHGKHHAHQKIFEDSGKPSVHFGQLNEQDSINASSSPIPLLSPTQTHPAKMVPRPYQAPVTGSVTVRPNVSALRSQFESLKTHETKNATKKTDVMTSSTKKARYAGKGQQQAEAITEAKDVAGAIATENDGEDDAASEYGGDDTAVEGAIVTSADGSGRSTPEHYLGIATTNPYGEQSSEPKHNKKQQLDSGSYSDHPVCQTLTVPVPSPPPREETLEETLGRLTQELEENHRAIESEQKASLEVLQDRLSSLS